MAIKDVRLLPGETVVKDLLGNSDCCSCTPDEVRLTDRRVIALRYEFGQSQLSIAMLEDISVCSLGRALPNWMAIIFFLIVSIILLAFSIDDMIYVVNYNNERRWTKYISDGSVAAFIFGLLFLLVAILIYVERSTVIHFGVKGDSAAAGKSSFSIRTKMIGSRSDAMALMQLFFALKEREYQEQKSSRTNIPAVTVQPGRAPGNLQGYATAVHGGINERRLQPAEIAAGVAVPRDCIVPVNLQGDAAAANSGTDDHFGPREYSGADHRIGPRV
mmetsp:Transcript_39366/g.77120  ORF Transcript_39366/g.77120 Transcript_39366/m.77120 type:complete len:274 (+) Transcript_39366:172-993(+)